jgi:hypothetical protein
VKVALIIIFNHKFEKNIDILERIYAGRFSDVYYLMPFYKGNKKNVIGVYENSFFFQGYVTQAFHQFFKSDYDYYYFISDDLILHPGINESNFTEIFHLKGRESFIPEIRELHKQTIYWRWTKEAYEYKIKRKGTDASSELPTVVEAMEKFKIHNLSFKGLKFRQVYKLKINKFIYERFSQFIPLHIWIKYLLNYLIHGCTFQLNYPVCGSYADTFAIPSYAIKDFCHYCGVFAATELFAELAIPTAMVLTCNKIVTENELEWKGKVIWNRNEIESFMLPFKNSEEFLQQFPEKCLYIHPVKLSKWSF